MTRGHLGAALVALCLTFAAVHPRAQAPQMAGSLEAAKQLYASAAYDDALAMLTALPTDTLDAGQLASVHHYRMLCLLALGRTADIDAVVAALLDADPGFRLDETGTAPRVVKVFVEARQRVVPQVARRRYEVARRHYARRDFAAAAADFRVVRTLLDDPAQPSAPDSPLAEMAQLAADFEEVSRVAVEQQVRAERERAAARAAAAAREAERAAAATAAAVPAPPPAAPAPAPAPPDGIYGPLDRGVVAPLVVDQELRRWIGPMPPPTAGAPLGTVEVVIDEQGAVIAARIAASINGFYDAVLLDSARTWRYRPATKDGRPVRFRRLVSLLAR